MESINYEKIVPFAPISADVAPVSAEVWILSDYDGRGQRQGNAMSSKIQIIISASVDMSKWGSRLDQMELLKEGWNGYKAPVPSRAAITTARSFIESLKANQQEPARVAPSAVGGVGITHKNKGRRVYVEFYNKGEVCALFSDGISPPKSERINPDSERFRDLTRRIREYLDA
jgi:hypothetical protein